MSVQLEIQDGAPYWFLSTDVWTVPGDPEGTPGAPIVGTPCYLWARVRNAGSTGVQNAQVRFYWANPSLGFDRTTANFIGTANVSLTAGETREVLCLTPWVPVYVNSGHECILAEAFHPTADPLPATPNFNVPTDRHVAQRNLSVVMAFKTKNMMFSTDIEVCNTTRQDQVFTIKPELAKAAELRPLLEHYKEARLPIQAKGTLENIGFVQHPCPSEEEMRHAEPELLEFRVAANTCRGVTVVGRLEGEAALLNVTQEINGREIGGLSIFVINGDSTKGGK